jgi:hypothetical protein
MEEALFDPCTRLRGLMDAWNRNHSGPDQMQFPDLDPENAFEEVELDAYHQRGLQGAATVDGAVGWLMEYEFAFDDLLDLAKRKIVWFGPDLFFKVKGEVVGVTDACQCFNFDRPIVSVRLPDLHDDGEENELQVYSRQPIPNATGCLDVFQSMTTSFLFHLRKCYGNRPPTDLYSISWDADWNNEAEARPRDGTATTTALSCNYVFRLMTASNANWTFLGLDVSTSVSNIVLRQFLNNSRNTDGKIRFGRHYDLFDFNVDYLRVLRDNAGPGHMLFLGIGTKEGGWSRERIQIVAEFLHSCSCAVALDYKEFPGPGPAPLITDAVGEIPGPAPLITDALSLNCNIVELVLDNVTEVDDELFPALGYNNRLLRLVFSGTSISEANWTALCQSLVTNSTLGYLRLHRTFPNEPAGTSVSRMVHRTIAFVRMLRYNTALQELDASDGNSDLDEFDESILSDMIQPYIRDRP